MGLIVQTAATMPFYPAARWTSLLSLLFFPRCGKCL
jgi:hypothetical protein